MIEKVSVIVAACCLSAALAFARPSLAAQPPTSAPSPRAVNLTIDVTELGDKGIGLDKVIRDHLGPRIEAADFALVGQQEAAIVLRLRLRVLESSQYDYGLHFEFVDGTTREPVIEWTDCHACVDDKLMSLLDDRLPAVLLALDTRAKQIAKQAEPVETVEPVPDESEPVDEPKSAPNPITGLGIGGSVIAGLGVGALIGGSVELSRGVVVESFDREQRDRIDHRPPGITLVSLGTTAIIVGAVMLGVDLAKQSRKRKRSVARRPLVFPILTPNAAGVGTAINF